MIPVVYKVFDSWLNRTLEIENVPYQADFGGAQIEEEELVVTNYFDCSTVPVRSYNLGIF